MQKPCSCQVNIRQLRESLKEHQRFRLGEDDSAKIAAADYDVKYFSMHARSIRSLAATSAESIWQCVKNVQVDPWLLVLTDLPEPLEQEKSGLTSILT